MSRVLPPGTPATEEEWLCDHCPNPACGKYRHFFWNLYSHLGYCQVCHYTLVGKQNFEVAFGLREGEIDDFFAFEMARHPTTDTIFHHPERWIHNAWDYHRGFLVSRGLTEGLVRQLPIWCLPEMRAMILKIDPISPEVPPAHLRRYGEDGKWISAVRGTHLRNYGFGIQQWRERGVKGAILVEGAFDVLSPRMLGYSVAVLGTQLTDGWCAWVQQNLNWVGVMFDPEDEDGVGLRAQRTAVRKLRSWGVNAVEVDGYKDPKNMVPESREDGQFLEALKELVCAA